MTADRIITVALHQSLVGGRVDVQDVFQGQVPDGNFMLGRFDYNAIMSLSDTTMERSPWYNQGLRFECTQCGNCCTGPPGYVWFDDGEATAIAEHLGISVSNFRRRYAKRSGGRWTLNEIRNDRDEYDCVFLRRDEQGKSLCSIYSLRPRQCRSWPFWPHNLRSKRAWQIAAKTCPGMNQSGPGCMVPVEQIRIIAADNPDGL